jgi:uncharacterized protein (DUF433 family)
MVLQVSPIYALACGYTPGFRFSPAILRAHAQYCYTVPFAPPQREDTLRAVLLRTTMYYMSQPLSVRLNDATISRLGARARRVHLPPRTLAQRYVEEGLRMDEHPLIRFADGPAGRRARLVGTGKDVWEVVAVVRDNDGDAAEAARYLEIPLGLVQAAITYYGAYTVEVDQQLEANEQETAEAHAAYLAGQAALRR